MQSLTPGLTVSDLSRSVAFYRDGLGFTVISSMVAESGNPIWVNLKHGAASLELIIPDPEDPVSPGGSGISLYLTVEQETDIDAYYAQVTSAGAPVTTQIADMPWDDRSFTVTDPDGYRIMIGITVGDRNFIDYQVFADEEANALFLPSAK
jgi:uncharacterized glyoxalase superfamily protein PhnB